MIWSVPGFRRLRLVALLALISCGVASAAPGSAYALEKGFFGPVRVDGRSQFPIYDDLGVTIYQYALQWDQVAPARPSRPTDPSDPAYRWPADLNDAVKEANRYGIKVAVLILGAPGWANGGRDQRWAPESGGNFGKFAEAASRRYRSVRYWMVWGEPTRAGNFQPISPLTEEQKTATTLPPSQQIAPRRYAQLLDAAYGAIKRVDRKDYVIGGMTFSGGDIRTYNWARYLKLSNGRRPRMDMWGHNPFGYRKPNFKLPQSSFNGKPDGVVDFSDLPRFAKFLDKQKLRTPRKRPLRLYLSEFALPTGSNANCDAEFNYCLSRDTQASFIKAALRLSRRFRRIYSFGYVHLYDDPPKADGSLVIQSGLIDSGGNKKPGYEAFKQG